MLYKYPPCGTRRALHHDNTKTRRAVGLSIYFSLQELSLNSGGTPPYTFDTIINNNALQRCRGRWSRTTISGTQNQKDLLLDSLTEIV